uniref:Inositol polyphosphate-related phosphatase domain-containing protein n=2 Tax=Compsopogon caeruleus TaxID=31354 RepID=A0A7S1XGQ9_9RHOD
MGGAIPPGDLREWLTPGFDIVAVGVQEAPSYRKQERQMGGRKVLALRRNNVVREERMSEDVSARGCSTPGLGDGEREWGAVMDSTTDVEGDSGGMPCTSHHRLFKSADEIERSQGYSPLMSIFRPPKGIRRDKAFITSSEFESLELSPVHRRSGREEESGPRGASELDGARRWASRLQAALGDDFVLVERESMMEIRLHVFVRRTLERRVRLVRTVNEKTGIANVVGNKGGVALKMMVDDIEFWFVSSHLAAHEGYRNRVKRNEDVMEIMKGLEPLEESWPVRGNISVPFFHRAHHVFWMGDLNYRLDTASLLPGSEGWSTVEKSRGVQRIISSSQEFQSLADEDELSLELSDDGVLSCFREGSITFPPTFKCLRNVEGTVYDSDRVPSYCDRILWHSLPTHQFHLHLSTYRSVPGISTSDHKPVAAEFEVFVPRRIRPVTFHELCIYLSIEIRGIRTTSTLFDPIKKNGMNDAQSEGEKDNTRSNSKRRGFLYVQDWRGTLLDSHLDRRSLLFALYPACFGGSENGTELVTSGTNQHAQSNGFNSASSESESILLPLNPVRNIGQLEYQYFSLVFIRSLLVTGPRVLASSACLPMAQVSREVPGTWIQFELDAYRFGWVVGKVSGSLRLIVRSQYSGSPTKELY